ncbi:MAG TPA: lipase family protein [Jatrophihabitantaceae bacterium]|jgi:hypothetical protein
MIVAHYMGRRLLALACAITGAASLCLVANASAAPGSSAAATPKRPAHDRFYRYRGTKPLSKIAPGTPLRTRTVTLALGSNSGPQSAKQILYRTTDARGHAVASVTTVLEPAGGTTAPKVVAYLSFYDALSARCDPSYTLRGGKPGSANEQNAEIEQGVVNSLNAAGYIVTVPDFENERLDYVAGTESGKSALDGIKATLTALKLKRSAPVGLMGYSGGSIAADWASELAHSYATHLNIVGTAMGGVPANLAHNLKYVNGSASWSDVMPAAMIGISRAYGLDLDKYLSKYGKKIVAAESHQCIGQFLGKYPNLTIKKLMKHKYEHLLQVPVFRRIMHKLVMGSAPGHPREPMYIVAGKSDSTGDGVMVEKDEAHLAAEYCKQGVPVDFTELQGLDHDNAGASFLTSAVPYLSDRFAGAPAPSTC